MRVLFQGICGSRVCVRVEVPTTLKHEIRLEGGAKGLGGRREDAITNRQLGSQQLQAAG